MLQFTRNTRNGIDSTTNKRGFAPSCTHSSIHPLSCHLSSIQSTTIHPCIHLAIHPFVSHLYITQAASNSQAAFLHPSMHAAIHPPIRPSSTHSLIQLPYISPPTHHLPSCSPNRPFTYPSSIYPSTHQPTFQLRIWL